MGIPWIYSVQLPFEKKKPTFIPRGRFGLEVIWAVVFRELKSNSINRYSLRRTENFSARNYSLRECLRSLLGLLPEMWTSAATQEFGGLEKCCLGGRYGPWAPHKHYHCSRDDKLTTRDQPLRDPDPESQSYLMGAVRTTLYV